MVNFTAIQGKLFADEYGEASRDIELLLGEDARLRTVLGTCKGGLSLLREMVRPAPVPDAVMVAHIEGLIGSVEATGI